MTAAKAPPCFTCPWDEPTALAVQALARGAAEPDQQVRALQWIVEVAGAAYQTSFVPESERQTSFLEGRRFVAGQIVKLTKINVNTLRKAQAK